MKTPLAIPDFITQPNVTMLVQLIYRVQFRDQTGNLTEQDFVLGWTFISPEIQPNGTDIVETKVKVKFQTGPGCTLTG